MHNAYKVLQGENTATQLDGDKSQSESDDVAEHKNGEVYEEVMKDVDSEDGDEDGGVRMTCNIGSKKKWEELLEEMDK